MDELIEVFGEEKRNVDSLKMNYFFDEDVDVCDYVYAQVSNFDIGTINYGEAISFDELVFRSVEELRIFGDDIHSRIQGIIDETSIHCELEKKYDFITIIGFQADKDGKVLVDSGMVDRYIIPKDMYELSVYHFAHEHIHALKETRYEEYQDGIILGEMLPIFFELLIYNPEEVLKKELIRFRIKALLINKKEYKLYDNLFRMSCVNEFMEHKKIIKNETTSMCEFLRSKVGNYLNSFYYALMLYSLYKETPKRILNLVNKVLKHEMTTLEMLNILGLYGDIRGETFEKELGLIRKIVK